MLSVRAANEYRGRDLIGYLSLRHLFRASSARLDRWATEIASNLTVTRTKLPYRHNRVYKGVKPVGDDKAIEYRDLHIPGPTEMLAEAALLDACSRAGGAFSRHPSAYSNVLSKAGERHGMVDPYFVWWKQRQTAIANAAKSAPRGLVIYFDIKKFYDSISYALTSKAWADCSQESQLPSNWRTLGEKLISDYQRVKSDHQMVRESKEGLLVGPIFAHMIGNLVLRELDRSLAAIFPGRYFRYVDDIAIVLDNHSLADAYSALRRALPPGLHLHEGKTLELDTVDWLRSTESFSFDAGTYFWGRLISGIKYFLTAHSSRVHELDLLLTENGFRIPLRDYRRSVKEIPYLEQLIARFRDRLRSGHVFPHSPNDLLKLAMSARHELQRRFDQMVTQAPMYGMRRKFQLQRIRYTATRLLYLGAPNMLHPNESAIENTNELSDIHAIYKALRISDVSELLSFSSSVAYAAVQVFAAGKKSLKCDVKEWRPELESAWAVLKAGGIEFAAGAATPSSKPVIDFSAQSDFPSTSDPYFEEVFALARGSRAKHKEILSQAFDYDEEPVLDAIQLLRTSS